MRLHTEQYVQTRMLCVHYINSYTSNIHVHAYIIHIIYIYVQTRMLCVHYINSYTINMHVTCRYIMYIHHIFLNIYIKPFSRFCKQISNKNLEGLAIFDEELPGSGRVFRYPGSGRVFRYPGSGRVSRSHPRPGFISKILSGLLSLGPR